MNGYVAIALICGLGTGQVDCDDATALDVIRGPEVSNEILCGLHGQALVAQLARPLDTQTEYLKITCRRRAHEDRAELIPDIHAGHVPPR
jgi:hypothetical protein